MVRSPVHRPPPRSPRVTRPTRGTSPPFSRPPVRRNSASPGRRRPNSRGGGSPLGDDPRRNRGPPGGCGGNQPRLSEVNRMPVASMRMRMDDYAPPKPRRNDHGAAIPPLMEQVVVRARREASTRTKDTFWTKKLLDAEDQYSKRGDRWAHSGFKELYRDELGYEPEPPQPPSQDDGGDMKLRETGGPVPRDPRGEPRDPRDPRRNSPNRPRDPRPKPRDPRDPRTSPERPRDPRTAAPVRPRDPRRPGDTVAPRKDGSPRRLSSTSKVRGRSRGRKSPSRRHRRHRRSLSGSGSSGSSSSSSGSFSRSRSYSRSSYSRSSSGSSSYTSTSSSRSRSRSRKKSYGKRRRSRSPGSRTHSSSLSPPRNHGKGGPDTAGKKGGGRPPPPLLMAKDIKKQQSSMHETTKKVVTKTVSNVVTTKTKMINPATGHMPPSHVKQSHRVKAKMKIKEDESLRKKGHGRPPPPHSDLEPGGPGPSASYYPNDEVNDSTIANRGSNGVPQRGSGTTSLPSPPNLSQPPPPLAIHHHHHNLEIYPGKPSKKLPPPQHLQHPADFPPPTAGSSNNNNNNNNPPSPRSPNEESESSSSSEEEETPRKMTLSERFGKLAQLSSQRQEYDGVRMKIVREGGQDKKVYLEAGLGSRSPSPLHPAHERWLAEHQTEYADYQRRYGDIRSWDPHRDLPRDLPPNWEDVGVRYRYYKQSGYFGDRHISLDDYLKWEEWWYQYRDWLKKYGGAAADVGLARHGKEADGWGDAAAYDRGRVAARWPQDTSRDAGPDRKRRRY